MNQTRIYCPQDLSRAFVELDKAASNHLLRVLRLRVGESINVFNGEREYIATIQSVNRQQAIIKIENEKLSLSESPLKIHLGQGISRGERMDYVIQKTVELGVNEITPLLTQRAVQLSGDRFDKKLQHWQQVAISASEQCGRCQITKINTPQYLASWVEMTSGLRLFCHPVSDNKLVAISEKPATISILIGPEGGLSELEIEKLQQSNFYPISLGPRTLRTETAPVVALTLLQSKWGDLS